MRKMILLMALLLACSRTRADWPQLWPICQEAQSNGAPCFVWVEFNDTTYPSCCGDWWLVQGHGIPNNTLFMLYPQSSLDYDYVWSTCISGDARIYNVKNNYMLYAYDNSVDITVSIGGDSESKYIYVTANSSGRVAGYFSGSCPFDYTFASGNKTFNNLYPSMGNNCNLCFGPARFYAGTGTATLYFSSPITQSPPYAAVDDPATMTCGLEDFAYAARDNDWDEIIEFMSCYLR